MTIYEKRRKRRKKAHVDTTDGRTDLITRQEAAAALGMSIRTISRYAALGYLLKFSDARGQILYAPEQVKAMGYFEAETKPGRPSG